MIYLTSIILPYQKQHLQLYHIVMIFNSISRNLKQQDNFRSKEQLQNSRSSYFPQRQFPSSNLFENIPQTTYQRSTHQSTLSKMNNKIAQNIEYLRYKDQLRANQLRSSRVSSTSNRSYRSNHSNKSLKSHNPAPTAYFQGTNHRNSQIRSYLSSEQSNIKTFIPPQTYLNQQRVPERGQNYWKKQNLNNSYQNKYGNNEFKYFTRNPVTIDTNYYHQERRQPQRDLNQSLQRSTNSNNSESLYDFPNQKKSKVNTLPTEYPRYSSGIEWNASFGSSMKNSKLTPNNDITTNIPPHEVDKKVGISKVDTAESLSPLSTVASSSKKPNKGLIISAGLIAFGVLILLLQILN